PLLPGIPPAPPGPLPPGPAFSPLPGSVERDLRAFGRHGGGGSPPGAALPPLSALQHQSPALPLPPGALCLAAQAFPGPDPLLPGGQPQTRGRDLSGPAPGGRAAAGADLVYRGPGGFCGRGPDSWPDRLALRLSPGLQREAQGRGPLVGMVFNFELETPAKCSFC